MVTMSYSSMKSCCASVKPCARPLVATGKEIIPSREGFFLRISFCQNSLKGVIPCVGAYGKTSFGSGLYILQMQECRVVDVHHQMLALELHLFVFPLLPWFVQEFLIWGNMHEHLV